MTRGTGTGEADPGEVHPEGTGVAAILLAAGRSRRMGRPKQLLRLDDDGATVVEELAAALRPLVDGLVVVVGHVGGQVAAVLAGHDLRLAVNGDVDRGMLSSVQCGLRAAGAGRRGYLICLGDQPAVDAGVVDAVLAVGAAGAGIAIPTWEGKRGHPVYVARRHVDEILGLDPTMTGLNAVTRGHPDDTVEVPVAVPGILNDMDTPEDFVRARARRQGGTAGAHTDDPRPAPGARHGAAADVEAGRTGQEGHHG